MILTLTLEEEMDLKGLLKQTVTNTTPNLNKIHQKLFHPKQHPTEIAYPLQTTRFREILDEMYQVHLDKNFSYSPFNIKATGMTGLCTRIWDKTARILSLHGFNLATGEHLKEKESINDESIEDNLLDLAVYSIIALIFRKNIWGK